MITQQIPFQIQRLSEMSKDRYIRGMILSTVNQCGAFLCTGGNVEVSLENQSYMINHGDIYIYMPSTLVRLGERSTDASGIMITIDIDYIIPIIQKVMNVESIFFFTKYPCIKLTEAQYNFLKSQLTSLQQRVVYEEQQEHAPQHHRLAVELLKSVCQTVIFELLNIYFINQPIHPVAQSKKDIIFQNFILMLFNSYRTERNVAYYAAKQQLTPRYFTGIIKEMSGMTALEWIVRMVINESKMLLETSDMSIKEISNHLNFPTQSFFGKYFKLYTGVSPKDYRKQAAL